MIKVAVIGIVAVLLAIQFRGTKSEYGTYIALVACMLIFYLGISRMEIIIHTIEKIRGYIKINPAYLGILVKIIGITYIAEFSSNLCKDAGHGAIANQIEIFGKLSILVISMPILLALLDTVNLFFTS